jgi:hypothetical protein
MFLGEIIGIGRLIPKSCFASGDLQVVANGGFQNALEYQRWHAATSLKVLQRGNINVPSLG